MKIEWLRNGKSLCKVAVPSHLRDLKLYPVCWIYSCGELGD